jgi:hypothetical protein
MQPLNQPGSLVLLKTDKDEALPEGLASSSGPSGVATGPIVRVAAVNRNDLQQLI